MTVGSRHRNHARARFPGTKMTATLAAQAQIQTDRERLTTPTPALPPTFARIHDLPPSTVHR